MKLTSPLIAGLVSLQAALLGVFSGCETITGQTLINAVDPPRLEAGRVFPNVAAYDAGKKRQNLYQTGKPTTIIYTGCGCEMADVKAWAYAATQRGESVTILLLTNAAQLKTYKVKYSINEKMLALRASDAPGLGGAPPPWAAHLSKTGQILSVEK